MGFCIDTYEILNVKRDDKVVSDGIVSVAVIRQSQRNASKGKVNPFRLFGSMLRALVWARVPVATRNDGLLVESTSAE